MKNLAELQAKCIALGIHVESRGRASKEPYIAALRDYHWQKDRPDESLPVQIMPMLLGSWDDLDETEAEELEKDCHVWIVQPKMDGVRALIHIEQDRVRITSRTVSEVAYRLSEFQDNLPHLTEGLSKMTGTILDGELVCPVSRLDTGNTLTESALQATIAILSTTPEKATSIQEDQDSHLRFHAFDILKLPNRDVTNLPLIERQSILESSLKSSVNRYIHTVPSFVVNKTEIHNKIIESGGEGSVWKRADCPYEPGRRVRHWIKRKRGAEIDAFVIGFKRGTNRHAELVGAVEFGIEENGAIVPVAWVSGWSYEERLKMTQADTAGNIALSQDYLNRRARLFGFELSAKSKRMRHARIKNWVL